MERLVAHDTLVGLFDAVRQLVIFVIALLMETFAAEFTDERFKSGVNANVRIERRTSVESFTTRVALMWLVLRVDDFMTTQGGRLAKTFAAYFAYERPRSRVNWHVPCEIVVRIEYLFFRIDI